MRHEQRSIAQLLTDNLVVRADAPTALTTATNTISAAGIINGLITLAEAGGAITSTLVTAALLDTALIAHFGQFPVGYGVKFTIVNLSTTATGDGTVTTSTGWTLVGTMVVAANATLGEGGNSSGNFLARKTANATFSLYRV
jgi:hypothetical protein